MRINEGIGGPAPIGTVIVAPDPVVVANQAALMAQQAAAAVEAAAAAAALQSPSTGTPSLPPAGAQPSAGAGATGVTAQLLDAVGGYGSYISGIFGDIANKAMSGDPIGAAIDSATAVVRATPAGYAISTLVGGAGGKASGPTGLVSSSTTAAGSTSVDPYTVASQTKDRGTWLKVAAGLGIAAVAAGLIWAATHKKGGGGGRKKKAKKSKKTKRSDHKVKRHKVKSKGKKKLRHSIVDPGDGGNPRAGSGRAADKRRGGGVSTKSVDVRRLRAAMKGAKKMKGAKGAAMRKGIKKALSKLHARA